ncbi:F-box protein [Cardamine amara subsp. amara]|uniref:F-box protein n=1 Tax=Cardamine amara subsp. amara TaxID=228776 RepID=A0ABD1C2H6_CARAN
MAHEEKLPRELIEEILSRVPPETLVRFRTVSKQWNALFDDKTFINNHKMTFRFILATKSKIYSVNIDPEIVVRELILDIPGLKSQIPKLLFGSNEFLLCHMGEGAAVWNPWLKQTRWVKADDVNQQHIMQIDGTIGYDNNRRVEETVYKTLGFCWKGLNLTESEESWWKIYDFASNTWKDLIKNTGQRKDNYTLHSTNGVSLNGTLYWISFLDMTDPFYCLSKFDFSRETFSIFCALPCGRNHRGDALVLRVFRGDRFSLLRQCHVTRKIEVWVTKNKINHEDGDDVGWMIFMTLSIPNLPRLQTGRSYSHPSYFIDDKRLVICSCDETGRAWIYVVEENKFTKMQIDSVVDPWPVHCTYSPSLVSVPRCQSEEAELQV